MRRVDVPHVDFFLGERIEQKIRVDDLILQIFDLCILNFAALFAVDQIKIGIALVIDAVVLFEFVLGGIQFVFAQSPLFARLVRACAYGNAQFFAVF